MRSRTAASVATAFALFTFAAFALFLMPATASAPSNGPELSSTAGKLALHHNITDRGRSLNAHFANAPTRTITTSDSGSRTERGAASPLASKFPSHASRALYRPSPGACLGMSLGGYFAAGFIWGLGLGPEAGVLVGGALFAYGVIRTAMCS